ncbi:MAG TPA: TonB-dependent receptor, partial [Saprospiraceae bacterium]|nr:TonB-dependent receptor [Saprospiraceae bacterium]
HSIKHMATLNFRSNSMTIFQTWTSRVFTSSDNAYFLKPYYLLDFSFGRNFKWGQWNSRLFFSVNNLFNNSYQTIENYPMPGINVLVGFKTEIFPKKPLQRTRQSNFKE